MKSRNLIDYVDDILQTTDTTEPYSWAWTERVRLGFYHLTVIAYDNCNNPSNLNLPLWKFL